MSWLFHRWLTFFGISLLVFNDCQSLFLKHSDSGKCITASEELVYDNPTWAFPYFVVMTDNCLNVSAQFRYLDSELLHNIEKKGTLMSTGTHVDYHSRWAVYKGVAANAIKTQNRADYRLKQTDAGSLFFYDTSVCAEPSTKYVLRTGTCDTEKQKFTFGSVTAYNAKMEYVHCSPEQKMVVKSADYGDFNKDGVFNDDQNFDTTCSKLTNCQVKSLCGGKISCELTMDNNLLPTRYCSDISKEIYTKYTCVDRSNVNTIAAPNIRLSRSPYEGYIQIKDGSTWRYVKEDNWDKNRQTMLCQHLGFDETVKNDIIYRQSPSGVKMATGDLICYNTQSSATSCCIQLEPSIANSQVDMPYVECNMCDKPLLQDETMFPDSIFSGKGSSSYKNARFIKNGWCTTTRNAKYLLIDLQKEYHLTRVVTMGSRSKQKRWIGSYSMKYSRDKSLANSQQMTGNKNGYQASVTSLHIYNVRYIKIESIDKNDFCLRIEFCGEVQTPTPVYDIEIILSDYSASVTWKILTASQDSSYITHYIIYLDGDELKKISREMYGTGFNILPLKPNTQYTVGIETEDSYSQRGTYVTKTFTTKQAEPFTLVPISYTSLNVTIPKSPAYIKEVMVIVQIATKNPTPVEDIKTSNLKPYQTDTQTPYITAYLKADALLLTFVIGDGTAFNYENKNYFNQPLKLNSNYIVFLRFFESKDSYYSTEWSNIVKTFEKPSAPNILNIISISLKMYTISWSIPSLPDQQTIHRYYANYSALNESSKMLSISREMTSVAVAVEFDKRYTFEIQIETEAGRSNTTSATWLSHSAPLEPANKTADGYTIVLRKPRKEQNIKTVALVLLKSKSADPPAPEYVTLEDSPPFETVDNVAFIARKFSIIEFQGDTIEISLRESKGNRRRKREVTVLDLLSSGATYRTTQLNTDESGNRIWAYWSEPFTAGGDDSGDTDKRDDGGGGSIGVAVGASFAVVVIIVALVLAFIFLRRRRTHKRYEDKEIVSKGKYDDEMKEIDHCYEEPNTARSDNPILNETNETNEGIYSNEADDDQGKAHPPVPVAEFAHYVNELKANEKHEFQKQYDDLPKNMKTSWEVAKKPFNKKKNRYGNIVTYDYCRVVLSGDENEDYINASYIDGIKENSYIASQGPNKLTVNDMWRMVWEQRSYSIVMVTSLVELEKPKCEKYWPDKGSVKYGDIEVTLMKTEEFAYHVTHTLQLNKDGEEREVRHYYFQSWPDHGVPKYPTQLLAFRRHFRTHHVEQSGPIVVHCSAGVGRTGVFLAVDTILDKLEKGVINSIDIFGQVCAMRERRMNMIQTLEQYIFVHEAILETILCGMNEVDSSKIQKEIEKLAEVIKASGITGFQEKFKRLGEVSPKHSPDECTASLRKGNLKKNHNKIVYPAESNRVPLQYVHGVEDSDYINAVFVHGYLGRNYFIATQSPLRNTISDFWRMVRSQKSSTIVLLNSIKDGTSFPIFWPTTRGQPNQYDSLTVQLDSETESEGIWTRKFILSSYPDLSDGQVVNIFHYTKWPDHRVPPNADCVIRLTSLAENSRKNYGQGPIVVVCSDGAGRTGTYIAISNLLERMKIEQAMDVFQAIKMIRGTRPQFVENAEQYRFCYAAMMAYLDGFSDYANFE
ncbi:receptor-type tyrosine- phosphatase epsilon-like isoform X1 [Paramuricea clavata]|uniref:protein-tyrosine-phosphatase n=1 Tax=Paramuricea clavata TaxID=317549 RepID=A0A6S7HJU9_PARCT|nr:receptor-type tyrosine- phosphatase epsilon-like isoform X1 [Paramuricea clavata]